MNGTKSNAVNAVLMALVGLLVGFIGGYLIGQSRPQQVVEGTLASQVGQPVKCPHDLEPKDAWIEAGFRCPNTDTVQILLSDCHCPVAHALKDRIKAELSQGKTGQEVRAELIAEYGDRLKLRGETALK